MLFQAGFGLFQLRRALAQSFLKFVDFLLRLRRRLLFRRKLALKFIARLVQPGQFRFQLGAARFLFLERSFSLST